ncbi:MAG: competence protein ComEC family protein [Proteobacteria bacterium]|nr:competence protein ComEC family protein [Pseudomonadota bacterium]
MGAEDTGLRGAGRYREPVEARQGRTGALAAGVRAEVAAQVQRWFLWAPVALGGGCAAYFALRSEPGWGSALLPVLASLGGVLLAQRSNRAWLILPAFLLAFGAVGVATAKLRTAQVAAPVLPGRVGPALIEGWVVDVDSPGAAGGRLILSPTRISGVERLPERIRVTVDPTDIYGPGSAVRLIAILNPPPGPASPGAYDFARDTFFKRIGGVGFAVKAPQLISLAEPQSGSLRLAMDVNGFRWSLARRIVDRLGSREGGVAAAMTTGHEAWLTHELLDDMRDSGLAHVLSISGLHMAVVGGFVFFAVRLGLAAWPWAVLRVDGKKVAAVAGLVAVGAYLIVSGAPSPAVRAAVTYSVAFLAILLGRRAITLRALAMAALIVLILQPEAVVQPGFQMSFAATAALVALAERWPRRVREINSPWAMVLIQRAAGWALASAAVSFVAGLATGPFAIQHFNRMASYGLVANLVTAPLSTFLIMPALALGALLELVGLGGPFLAVAGLGTGLMLDAAERVSALPGAVQVIGSAPALALPVAFLGVLWVCLWDGRLRWIGLPFAAAVLIWPRAEPPDVWISDGGGQAALVSGRRAEFMRPERQAFAADLWSRRRGLSAVEGETRFQCRRTHCVTTGEGLRLSSYAYRKPPKPERWAELCSRADVVVLRGSRPEDLGPCRGALVLGAEDFASGGSVEIWREGSGWRLVWAQDLRGDRPWTTRSELNGSGA